MAKTMKARGHKDRDDGSPETRRHGGSWQVTTWLSQDDGWMLRVDGPDDWNWEESDFLSRNEAWAKGSQIIEGIRDHHSD